MAQAPAAAQGAKGPDILGLRTGMTPQEVYTLLQSIDSTHRVTVGQILIPPILGNQPVVYGMSPETLGAGNTSEAIAVSFSLPPNPQQVFMIHRRLVNTIHTTVDQIVASLRQKYGQESVPAAGGPNNPVIMVCGSTMNKDSWRARQGCRDYAARLRKYRTNIRFRGEHAKLR